MSILSLSSYRVGRHDDPHAPVDPCITRIDHRSGEPLVQVPLLVGGTLNRDLVPINRHMEKSQFALRSIPLDTLEAKLKVAAQYYRSGKLRIGRIGDEEEEMEFDRYVEVQSAISGKAHHMVRTDTNQVADVLEDLRRITESFVEQWGRGYTLEQVRHLIPQTNFLGVVTPDNSPVVHTLWLPALMLGVPVVLKVGEPLSAERLRASFEAAGLPPNLVHLYHGEGKDLGAKLLTFGRSMIFGGADAVEKNADNPRIHVNGPGCSKIIFGDDEVDNWPDYVDMMAESAMVKGGLPCISGSSVWASRHAADIAAAIAEKIGPIEPLEPDDPAAQLVAYPGDKRAPAIWEQIEDAIKKRGVTHHTARYGDRLIKGKHSCYIRPVVLEFDRPNVADDIKAGKWEQACPCIVSVTCPQSEMLNRINYAVSATVITRDEGLRQQFRKSGLVEHLRFGGNGQADGTHKYQSTDIHGTNILDLLYGEGSK